MADDLLTEVRDRVCYITLNMPETKNAVTPRFMTRLAAAVRETREMDDVRCVVIGGTPGSFCSGARLTPDDDKEFGAADLEYRLKKGYHPAFQEIWNLRKPVVAAVDGPAVGVGGGLALVCDIRVGTARARYGEVFPRIGLMSDGGGTYLLPRLVGLAKATELMYLGDIIDADDMHTLGLLNHVWPVEEFPERVHELAVRLASGPPLVYARLKETIHANMDATFLDALDREAEHQGYLGKSKDFMIGVAAWAAKEKPEFTGEPPE